MPYRPHRRKAEIKEEIKEPAKPSKADIAPPLLPEQKKKPRKKEVVRKSTHDALERRRNELEKELKEQLKPYIGKIKESIETMEGDKLYEFVKTHPAYGDEGSRYTDWNRHFFEYFGFKKLDTKASDSQEQARYASALQLYLGHHFNEQSGGKDIFQARSRKGANPFIYIDGKLGGFTMSVLAEYWNDKFYPTKKDKTKYSKLGHARLGDGFAKKGNNQKIFNEALAYLDRQLKGGVSQEVQKPSPPVSQKGSPPLSPEVKAVPAVQPQKKIIKIEDLPREIQDGVKGLLTHMVDRPEQKRIDRQKELVSELLTDEKSEINEFRRAGPDAEWDIDVIDDEYTRPDSWPRDAYKRYQTAYLEWEKADREYKKIKKSVFRGEQEKLRAKNHTDELYELQLEALGELETAITRYFEEEDEIYEKTNEELRRKIIAESAQYKFPPNFDLSKMNVGNFAYRHPQVRLLGQQVPTDLWYKDGVKQSSGAILSFYLQKVPTVPFAKKEDFHQAIRPDKIDKLENIFRYHHDPIKAFNALIYINNIEQFNQAVHSFTKRGGWFEQQLAKRGVDADIQMLAEGKKRRDIFAKKREAIKKQQMVASSGKR